MDAPAKYQLIGTRRRVGSQGNPETFEAIIIACGYDDAQHIARENWRDQWQDVLFKRVVLLA